jgi:extracellular elastinolytic metalloproteinase
LSSPDTGSRPLVRWYTSPANAFPGFNPRPVAPEMILRSFRVPEVRASHVRIVVLDNQCTGNTAFHGDQDSDPTSGSDCRLGSPGGPEVPIFGDLPQVVAPRDNEVHIAELQVFSRGAGGGGD